MSAGPDRAAHRIRNTLHGARTLADFDPGPLTRTSTPREPAGRLCRNRFCDTRLSVYNHGIYCNTCATRLGYQVADKPPEPTCSCGAACERRRSNGRPNGYYPKCATCRARKQEANRLNAKGRNRAA